MREKVCRDALPPAPASSGSARPPRIACARCATRSSRPGSPTRSSPWPASTASRAGAPSRRMSTRSAPPPTCPPRRPCRLSATSSCSSSCASSRPAPIDDVRARLDADPALVHAAGPHPFWGGRPQPLHVAIESNRDAAFDLARPRRQPRGIQRRLRGWSPLMLTAHRGRVRMREALLARGARVGIVEALLLEDDVRLAAIHAAGADGLPAQRAQRRLAADVRAHAVRRRAAARPRRAGRHARPLGHLADRGVQPARRALHRPGRAADRARRCRAARRPRASRRFPGARSGGRTGAGRRPRRRRAHGRRRRPAARRRVLALGARRVRQRARGGAVEPDGAPRRGVERRPADGDLLAEAGADLPARDEEHDATPQGWAQTALEITRNPACGEVARYLAVGRDAGVLAPAPAAPIRVWTDADAVR